MFAFFGNPFFLGLRTVFATDKMASQRIDQDRPDEQAGYDAVLEHDHIIQPLVVAFRIDMKKMVGESLAKPVQCFDLRIPYCRCIIWA